MGVEAPAREHATTVRRLRENLKPFGGLEDMVTWVRGGALVAPGVMVIASEAYLRNGWELSREQRREVDYMAKTYRLAAEADPRYRLHCDWFALAQDLEDEKAGFSERWSRIQDFFIDKGVVVPGNKFLKKMEAGLEAMDGKRGPRAAANAFQDYWWIKLGLSIPTLDALKARIKGRKLAEVGLRSRESVLLKNQRVALMELAEYENSKPLLRVLEVGVGKGETVVHSFKHYQGEKPLQYVIADQVPAKLIEENLREVWGHVCPDKAMPQITYLGSDPTKNVKLMEKGGQAIFIAGDVDVSEGIPLPDDFCDAVTNSYVLHHPDEVDRPEKAESAQTRFIRECVRVARRLGDREKAVMFFDGIRDAEAFLKVFVPVIALTRRYGTGIDGAISWMRGVMPGEARQKGETANNDIDWEDGYFGATVPRIIRPLLTYLIGFDPDKIKLKEIGKQL